jgi:hypothetical protein
VNKHCARKGIASVLLRRTAHWNSKCLCRQAGLQAPLRLVVKWDISTLSVSLQMPHVKVTVPVKPRPHPFTAECGPRRSRLFDYALILIVCFISRIAGTSDLYPLRTRLDTIGHHQVAGAWLDVGRHIEMRPYFLNLGGNRHRAVIMRAAVPYVPRNLRLRWLMSLGIISL